MRILLLAAVIVCGLINVVNSVFAQGLTFATKTLAVGNGPSSVISVDINNDGEVDLICTDSKDNTLMVLTNDGSGGFVSNATYNVPGVNPACVVTADITGNGKPDLIAAIYDNNSLNGIVVLTNNGSGAFGSNAVYSVGLSPSCVVAADVNGDGKLDLITANTSPFPIAGLTVLTNDGSGGFGLDATLNFRGEPPSLPHWVAAADVNGDGKVDLISANLDAMTLTVFTNDGSGDFGSNATYSVGLQPQCVVAADINGDGKVDLISANSGNNTLTVLTNDGSGNFVSNATYNVGSGPFFVTAADINGDGKLDLICANSETNTLTVLTNDGSGGFDFCTTLTVGDGPRSIAVANVNGKLDLITANYGDKSTGYGSGNTLTVLTQVTPPPELTIASISPDFIVVSWSSTATNFVLQTNADLTTTNWGTSDYTISTNGQLESITISPLPLENLFFRLKQ